MRRKEYADRIRSAAGTVTAKLERRKELSIYFFDTIQTLLSEADMRLVKNQDIVATRDYLWRELVSAQAASLSRISEEQLEIAYKDLYGYDPKIQELFTVAVEQLKTVERTTSKRVLYATQNEVLGFRVIRRPFTSAQLGNTLRDLCSQIALDSDRLMSRVIASFRQEMIKLIRSKDDHIFKRKAPIANPSDVFARSIGLVSEYERSAPLTLAPFALEGACLEVLSNASVALGCFRETNRHEWRRTPADRIASRSPLLDERRERLINSCSQNCLLDGHVLPRGEGFSKQQKQQHTLDPTAKRKSRRHRRTKGPPYHGE